LHCWEVHKRDSQEINVRKSNWESRGTDFNDLALQESTVAVTINQTGEKKQVTI